MVRENTSIAVGIAEMLVQRLQSAGYELQRSLPLVSNEDAIARIEIAVEHLNEAIKAIQLASSGVDRGDR